MPKGQFTPKETTVPCCRCGRDFTYMRLNAHRIYCDSCRLLERSDSNRINSAAYYRNFTKPARQARMEARKK